jgi:hypothetical protein
MVKKLKYSSNEEFYASLEPMIIAAQQEHAKKRLPVLLMLRILLDSGEVKVLNQDSLDERVPCMMNYTTQSIELGYTVIANHLTGIGNHYKFTYSITDVDLEKTYISEFRTRDLEVYEKAPNTLLNTQSGVYDLEKKKYTKSVNPKNGNEYYLANPVKYDIVKLSKVNKNMLQVVQKVFNDWSQGDPIRLDFLKSLVLATAMGNGFKKYIMIQGSGGNGKSTFLNLLRGVVGPGSYLPFNMQDLENDAHMATISEETKVLLGDDLANRAVLSNNLLNRFKQLVTGNDVLVNRKFLSSTYVKMQGVKIQATNDFPRFMETGDMILDRTIVYQWTNVNYRLDDTEKNEIQELVGYSLDELIGEIKLKTYSTNYDAHNEKFYTALMSWIVNTTEIPTQDTFDQFQKEFRIETEEAFESSQDVLDEVFKELDSEGAFQYRIICANAVYYRYVEHLKSANPSAKPTSRHMLIKRLDQYLKKYPHIRRQPVASRYTSLPYTECNLREYTQGVEVREAKKQQQYKWLHEKSILFENSKATHILDEYDNHQIKLIMNELAIKKDVEIDEIYALGKLEFEILYDKYKDEIDV